MAYYHKIFNWNVENEKDYFLKVESEQSNPDHNVTL